MDFSLCQHIVENISKVIVGKKDAIELLLVALLGDGHVLIEDVPGVGKTLIAKSLAKSMGGAFKRVQFTPDLIPAIAEVVTPSYQVVAVDEGFPANPNALALAFLPPELLGSLQPLLHQLLYNLSTTFPILPPQQIQRRQNLPGFCCIAGGF